MSTWEDGCTSEDSGMVLDDLYEVCAPAPCPCEPTPQDSRPVIGGPPRTWTACLACSIDPLLADGHHGEVLRSGTRMCHLVEVLPGTFEHIDVLWPLFNSDWGNCFTPVAVYRVQNYDLYDRFDQMRARDAESPWQVPEPLDLWHGTPASDKDLRDVLLHGLDQRLSHRGYFGNGIYFSDSTGKASRYTAPRRMDGRVAELSESHVRTLFRCKVNVGHQLVYPPGVTEPSLRREPPDFDSVRGNVTGADEYVVYENARVYTEYMIKYKYQPSQACKR
eukprot:m.15838 g.15838  ORF g.15838 m.15838 type:complete len:277 (-) comp4971_c0_seq1:68-898(-)